MGLQIAITFGLFLSILGFVYFLKSRNTTKAGVSGVSAEVATETTVPATKNNLLAKIHSGWQAKNLEQKRWFLYTWLMVLAILVVYAVPHVNQAYESKRFLIGGIVVLLGLHLVIWPFFTEKTSMSTKIVATAVFLFLIMAVLAPNAAVRAMDTADKAIEDFDKNGITLNHRAREDGVPQPAARKPMTREIFQTLHALPGGNFQKADIPPGVVIESIKGTCPAGCIVQVEHDGFQICTTGVYQGTECDSTIVEYRNNIVRYREYFVQHPDFNIDLPKDLVRVIFSFGTDEVFGPVEVYVTSVISGG